ncbi:MAG: alpha/beta fold hydrolase [Gammaproteobacteria bacterium]
MQSRYLQGLDSQGFHTLHYTEWGDPLNRNVLVCVHGLTRNGRDFDAIGDALQQAYRVVCPDLPGRGRSSWLTHKADYGYPLYLQDLVALIARLDVEQLDWLGTSLGGLIGMFLAARPGNPIRRLLLNDVGPVIPEAALDRIGKYVGRYPEFATLNELEGYLRTVHAGFGPLSDAQWQHLAAHSHKRLPNGEYALCYDPAIGEAYRRNVNGAVEIWSVWDAIRCPVTVFRGSASDVLLPANTEEMQVRGPPTTVLEFGGVGHAPALMSEEQIDAVNTALSIRWPLPGILPLLS